MEENSTLIYMDGILISAIGSLIASIATFAINTFYWVNKDKKKFYHEIDQSDYFSYNGDTLRVYNIILDNQSREAINEIECRIKIQGGEISSQQTKADREVTSTVNGSNLDWKLPSLNSFREMKGLIVVKEERPGSSMIEMNAFGKNINSTPKPIPVLRDARIRILGGIFMGIAIASFCFYIFL